LAGNGRLRAFPRLIEPFPPVFLTTNAADSKLNPFVTSSPSFPGSFLASSHSPEAVAWHNRPWGRGRGSTPMRVAFGEYQLDTETRTLQREGRRIPVQSKAFDLLAYLIERRERVVSSNELLDALWPGLHVSPAALSTAVQKARHAVGDDGEHQAVLQTEHGKGFRFVAKVTDLSAPKADRSAPESAFSVAEAAQPNAEATRPTPATDRSEPAGSAQTSLFAELKRRNVFRVGAAYGIVGWLLVEVASVVLPTFEAPTWVMKALTFLVILGFPLALILAWVFELTPEGIKFEKKIDRAESIAQQTGRKLDFAIIGLLAIAVVCLALDKFVFEADPEQAFGAPEKSIAVLPFDNISPKPEDAYFADGIHDELLTQLSKIRDLTVISRTSVMRYSVKDRPSLPEIAANLGVANILEGSVRIAGNRVRITAQLVEAKRDTHLWAQSYDREFTAANVFSIQSEVAREVTNALNATLSQEERDRMAVTPTQNLAAYQTYLLGKQRLARMMTASIEEAVEFFQQAIELDPKFSLAYAGLTESYLELFQNSDLPPDEMLARAEVATNKALELDDGLAEAHAALGQLKWFKNDFGGAEAEFQRALALNPNSVVAHYLYANFLWFQLDQYDEALALSAKAVELDPLSLDANFQLAKALNALGRFDESLARCERLLEIDVGYPHGYTCIAFHHATVSGRIDEALVWSARALALDPGSPFLRSVLGWQFLDLGDADRAEYWIQRSVEVAPDNFFANLAMQDLASYRGDDPVALQYGRKAFAIWPLEWKGTPLSLLRDHEARAGHYVEARSLYEEHFPELLGEGDPEVNLGNYRAAIDLALILSRTGEPERADLLLEESLPLIERTPRSGLIGYGLADVQIHALRGETQKALASLREAIDEGWRGKWWYQLQRKPDLEPLHDEPEFQAMVATPLVKCTPVIKGEGTEFIVNALAMMLAVRPVGCVRL